MQPDNTGFLLCSGQRRLSHPTTGYGSMAPVRSWDGAQQDQGHAC